tara:strand:+ start:332 stop:601 length:270 start_codon:yes stop_codon:yes gene_type:complete
MVKVLLVFCILMNMTLSMVIICPDTVLVEKNKIWSEQWCEALLIRNKVLMEKYGKDWYKSDVYKTIPKEELETELLKKLRKGVINNETK